MAKPKRTSLPVYDDYGNHVGMPVASRTFERKQGCWNCKSYDTDEVYSKRVQDCFDRDRRVLIEQFGLDEGGKRAAGTRRMLLQKRGIFGVCLKGKVEGDFVGCKHLCVDGWDGRQGVIGSLTPGEAFDEPVAALYDDKGETIEGDSK